MNEISIIKERKLEIQNTQELSSGILTLLITPIPKEIHKRLKPEKFQVH